MIAGGGLDRLDGLDRPTPPHRSGHRKTSPGGWYSEIDRIESYEARRHGPCNAVFGRLRSVAAGIAPCPGGVGVQPPLLSNPRRA
jgi:hypothetical protein